MIKLKDLIKESFELPPEIDSKAEILAKFIASTFLKYFEKGISTPTNKADPILVKYHHDYRLAKQYQNEGNQIFNIYDSTQDTSWGMARHTITSKNEGFPDTILYITEGYPTATNGYMNVTDKSGRMNAEDKSRIFILVDRRRFLQSFDESVEELIDTVKHEVRHWYQFNKGPKEFGLQKSKTRSKTFNPFGIAPGFERQAHHMRDAEFKTNLHSDKYYIEKYLNRNTPKKHWKREFKKMMMGNKFYVDDEPLNHALEAIDDMRKKDRPRWEQFVKELYKLIFPND